MSENLVFLQTQSVSKGYVKRSFMEREREREKAGSKATYRSDDVGNVRDSCARRSAEVKNLAARGHVNTLNTTEDGCGKL